MIVLLISFSVLRFPLISIHRFYLFCLQVSIICQRFQTVNNVRLWNCHLPFHRESYRVFRVLSSVLIYACKFSIKFTSCTRAFLSQLNMLSSSFELVGFGSSANLSPLNPRISRKKGRMSREQSLLCAVRSKPTLACLSPNWRCSPLESVSTSITFCLRWQPQPSSFFTHFFLLLVLPVVAIVYLLLPWLYPNSFFSLFYAPPSMPHKKILR